MIRGLQNASGFSVAEQFQARHYVLVPQGLSANSPNRKDLQGAINGPGQLTKALIVHDKSVIIFALAEGIVL
ncbi:MAG: hypothetical protein ABIN58_10535 [candidate division WOR-3 bacterium]